MEKHNEVQPVDKLTLFCDSLPVSDYITQEIESSRNVSVDRYGVAQFNNQDPQTLGNVIVSFTNCQKYALRKMSEGIPPKKAVAEWCNHARDVIKIVQLGRGKTLLFEEGSFWTDFFVVADHLELKFGIHIARRNAFFADEALDDPVQFFLAQQAFQLDPIARRFQAELVALCSISPPKKPDIDPDSAFSQLNQQRSEAIQRNEDRILELEKVLQCKIEELAGTRSNLNRVEEDKLSAQREVSLITAEKAIVDLEIENVGLENKKLNSRINYIWSELEEALKDAHELRQVNEELNRLKNENENQSIEIEALRNSTSWKITGPIRALRLAFSGKGK